MGHGDGDVSLVSVTIVKKVDILDLPQQHRGRERERVGWRGMF